MRVKALLLRSLDALAAVGVVPVLLKGYGLGLRLYPEPLQRATTDVDLLVAGAEVEGASGALVGLGLRPLGEEAAAHARAHEHHLTFTGAAGMVELHFRALVGYGRRWRRRRCWRERRRRSWRAGACATCGGGRAGVPGAPREQPPVAATGVAV